ncbi:hypothetical protein OH76DRAFT_1411522 [Lentinus brumalis]|uniref:Uncharacterized protein n=1 Tax=Lentinus brumalis TaxID=2498619 RepID=A0A371CP58_9APHY|nr:hypothetical protein OH76DRAFT_1411522 [Polyporus brumalis]
MVRARGADDLVGRRLDVRHRTDGISGAAQQGFKDWREAKEYFDDALARGETRVVTRAPQPERRDREPPAAEMPKAPKQRQRPTQQKQPTRSEQKPRIGGGSSVARGGSWSPASGSAKRDAEIKAAVEEVNREKQRSASARERRAEPPQRAASGAALSASRAITAPPRLPTAVSPHPVSASASAAASASRQRQRVLDARASVPPAASAGEAEPPKSSASFSTSSSPPTAVTQTKNIFSSDGGNQSPGPYAQSLSYASSPGNWSAGLRSPPLASSDCQSHLSEPSTLRTKYFPSDFLARQAKVRSPQRTARSPEMTRSPLARSPPAVLNDRRPPSPAISDSEYATAPNTPDVQSVDLAEEHSLTVRRRTSAEAMPPPPLPPPPRDTRISEGTFESTTSPSKRRKSRLVGRSMSEAQVQTEHSIQSRRRRQDHAAVQTSPPMKRYMEGQAQTSPVSSPRTSSLRSTSSEGNVFRHSPASTTRPICMCVRPRHMCRFCGGEERIQSSASHSPAPSAESSVRPPPESTTPSASPVSVSSKSRASLVTPVPSTPSSPSSERRFLRSPVGGHTPILGPSETQTFMRPITNSIQSTMNAMNFSEPARGAGAVVHDMRFDPRSPLQRGTTIPAGTSGSVTRPSPAMLPLNSLLFG